MDDARLSPEGNHIDGYVQPQNDLTIHQAHDIVGGLNVGGWHDAFRPEIDVTSIDQAEHKVEIHQPDGKNDILQQIEHIDTIFP